VNGSERHRLALGDLLMPATGSILVVDDHDDSRDMIAEYLCCIGYAVSTAADGAEAVARAEQLRPDVVLMDLVLPGVVDGCEATRRIKASPLTNGTVVIALTAHALLPEREQALRAGVVPCSPSRSTSRRSLPAFNRRCATILAHRRRLTRLRTRMGSPHRRRVRPCCAT